MTQSAFGVEDSRALVEKAFGRAPHMIPLGPDGQRRPKTVNGMTPLNTNGQPFAAKGPKMVRTPGTGLKAAASRLVRKAVGDGEPLRSRSHVAAGFRPHPQPTDAAARAARVREGMKPARAALLASLKGKA